MRSARLVTFLLLAITTGCGEAAPSLDAPDASGGGAPAEPSEPGDTSSEPSTRSIPEPAVSPRVCLAELPIVSAESEAATITARLTVEDVGAPLGVKVLNADGGEPMFLADHGKLGDQVEGDGVYSRLVRIEGHLPETVCATPADMGMTIVPVDELPGDALLGAGDPALEARGGGDFWDGKCPYKHCSDGQSACFGCGGTWSSVETCLCGWWGCWCWTVTGCYSC